MAIIPSKVYSNARNRALLDQKGRKLTWIAFFTNRHVVDRVHSSLQVQEYQDSHSDMAYVTDPTSLARALAQHTAR